MGLFVPLTGVEGCPKRGLKAGWLKAPPPACIPRPPCVVPLYGSDAFDSISNMVNGRIEGRVSVQYTDGGQKF